MREPCLRSRMRGLILRPSRGKLEVMAHEIFRIATLGIALVLAAPNVALADEATPAPATAPGVVPDALMKGLAAHADRLEEMKKRGAYTFKGVTEELDGDGKVEEKTEMECRSTPTGQGMDRIVKWMHYAENGKDSTTERQKKSDEFREKRKKEAAEHKKNKNDWKLPFLSSEQSRYTFTLSNEQEAGHPERVKIFFNPKEAAEDAFKGSAWVDTNDKEVLSAGFSFSKNPTFIDHVDITMVFGLQTPLGRGPSQMSFDGKGGFLFIHKHYRGSGTISDPKLVL